MLVHGIGKLVNVWPKKIYSKGSSIIIHSLVQAISKALLVTGNTPETLYLQMDNTSAENKNKYVLGWTCYLVQQRIFKDVVVNFLPVGHTHEDIDTFWGKLSSTMKKMREVLTPSDFLKAIRTAIATDDEQFCQVDYIYSGYLDYANWLEPYLYEITSIKQV